MSAATVELDPKILTSRRFQKAYRKANVGLQGVIEGAVHDMVNRIRADKNTFSMQYARVQSLKRSDVLEVDVSGSHRMLAIWESELLRLLDVGGHEVVKLYDDGKLSIDSHQKYYAPRTFWPDDVYDGLRFFSRNPCETYLEYGPEQHQDWFYFLSDEQEELVDDVLLEFDEEIQANKEPQSHLIIGGPGTGKTVVLFRLLKGLTDFGYTAKIAASDEVCRQISLSLPDVDLDSFHWTHNSDQVIDVLLVDDPNGYQKIDEYLTLTRMGSVRSVVIAFDPCQLDSTGGPSGLIDEQLSTLCSQHKVVPHDLRDCYRQKENVGEAVNKMLVAIAESSPFLAEHKKQTFHDAHTGVTQIANNMQFPNPYGYTEIYRETTCDDYIHEINRIGSKPLWSHWPPLLIAIDREDPGKVDQVLDWIESVPLSHERRIILADDFYSVKGLEYQHAFLFITAELYDQLENNFTGSGQSLYAKRRLLRIPFSRAKDSMVTFVI